MKVWIGFLAALALPSTAFAQNGLTGEYFPDPDFTATSGAMLTRTDATLNFGVFADADFSAGGATDISVRWVGSVLAPGAGTAPIPITFYVRTDDGGRCWVDGLPVVDQWRDQGIPGSGTNAPKGVINLIPGQRYAIVVEMYEKGGGEGCILEWEYAGQAIQVVPTGNLFTAVPPPRLSVAGGALTNGAAVSAHCPVPGVVLTYNIGGGPLPYTGPVVLPSGSTTLTVTGVRAPLTNGVSMATYTVTDSTAPALSMIQSYGESLVRVVFSEPVTQASAQTTGNYTFNPAVTVDTATLQFDQRTVILSCTGLVADTLYTVTAAGVADRTAGTAIPVAGDAKVFRHRAWRQTNLVDWYRCDERTGLTLTDNSGVAASGGNDGTLPTPTATNTGPYFIEDGKFLGGLQFDGENDVITMAASWQPVLGAADSSIAFWIRTKCNGGPSDNIFECPALIGAEFAGADDIFWGSFSQAGQIGIAAGDVRVQTPTAVNNAAWHHVVMTWATATGNVQIFIDGAASVSTPAASATGPRGTVGNTLGKTVATPFWTAYPAAIDELRVYNGLLTQADALNLANTIPSVVASGPAAAVDVGTPANLTSAHAADDGLGGAAISYAWTQLSGGAGATIVSPAAQNTAVNFTQAGTFVFRVTITDGHLSTSDDVTVDVNRISVSPTSGLNTTEGGGTANFTVTLFQPLVAAETVTIPVSSTDTGEGLPTQGGVTITQLVFTAANWNTPQTVVVVGQEDPAVDGPQPYTITLGVVTGPAGYNGTNPPDVTATNADNDTAAILMAPVVGLTTTEAGGTATFTVRLQTAPSANVTINFASTDTGEGTVSPPSATFDAGNFGTDQTITITGVDDALLDFSQSYFITTTVTSADANYGPMNPPDPSVTNLDNETVPEAQEAWGNCGLLGVEVLLPIALAALHRRRRSRRRPAP
ncbi:MAG TPA: PA14 domain-containing protein [Planctomycetota bacterium]